MAVYPLCKLCGKRGTMAHILSGWHVSLTHGRHRWRNGRVFRELADMVEKGKKKNTQFVREGQDPAKTKKSKPSLFDQSTN
jgi:hypothetical protein